LTAEALSTYGLESGVYLSEFRFLGSASFNIQSTIVKRNLRREGGSANNELCQPTGCS
jgi:hypothetical protein